MGSRAEGAARVDHDGDRLRGRALPRGPDPERADADAVVEVAPRVRPALVHLVDRHDVEPERRLIGVDGVAALKLLDALGKDVEQERGLSADDDVPPQRKALLSLPNRPSGLPYVLSSACSSNSCSRRRCSSVSRRGTRTLTRTRWSPRPRPCRIGMPRPCRTAISPGCVPGANSTSSWPSRVGIERVAPSAACVKVRSAVA